MCLTLPDTLITVMGIEKLVPTWQDLEVFLQLLPRSSTAERMNPYTSRVDRRDSRRRPAEVPPRADRQRPHRDVDGLRRAPGAAVHQMLGVPERLPGLRTHRRPVLRLGLPRPDRRDPHAAAGRRHARPAGGLTSFRLFAVRRLLRGLPGADRHPVGAHAPARRGRGSQGPHRRVGRDGRRGVDLRVGLAATRRRRKPVPWPGSSPGTAASRHCRGRVRSGRPPATCPRRRPSRSAPGGGRTVASAREEILRRIRDALVPAAVPVVRGYNQTGPAASSCSPNGSPTTARSCTRSRRPRSAGTRCGASESSRRRRLRTSG